MSRNVVYTMNINFEYYLKAAVASVDVLQLLSSHRLISVDAIPNRSAASRSIHAHNLEYGDPEAEQHSLTVTQGLGVYPLARGTGPGCHTVCKYLTDGV